MLLGEKFKCYCRRWRFGFANPSFDAGGYDATQSAALTSYWTPDLINKNTGIQVSVTSTTIGTDRTEIVLDIPDLGIHQPFSVAGWQDSAEGKLEIYGLRVTNRFIPMVGYVQYVEYTSIKLYLDGVLKWTGGASSLFSERVTAAGIPLIGVPPTLSGGAGISPSIVAPSYATRSSLLVLRGDTEIYGSDEIQFEEDGPWFSAPVAITTPTRPSFPEDCPSTTLPNGAVVSGTNTSEIRVRTGFTLTDTATMIRENETCDSCAEGEHATIPNIRDVYEVKRTVDEWGADVMLLPNIEKSVRRWRSSNFAQAVLRYGFPRVLANAVATCGEWGGDTAANSSSPEVYPEVSALLGIVENATHAIEDVMERATIAPANLIRSRATSTTYETDVHQFALCSFGGTRTYPDCIPIDPDSTTYAQEILRTIYAVQRSTGTGGNGDILGDLDHDDAICRYIDTCCSPHWAYFAWFPANNLDEDGDGTVDSQEQWPVDGNPIDVTYWIVTRQQWAYQALLPTGEKTKRRLTLPMDPLYLGHLSGFAQGVLGPGVYSNWFGQQNYEIWDKLPPTSITYNSSSSALISGTDCTLAFGSSGITVTPDSGHTTLIVEIDMGSNAIFTNFPYGYPLLAAEVLVGLDPGNVTSWAASWISVLSTEKQFATANGRYVRPVGVDDGYAFSFQDLGSGYVDDWGEDILPAGNSAAAMLSPTRVHGSQMVAGKGARKLRFTIQATNDTDPILIHWPTLYMSTGTPYVFDENGGNQIIAWENGPAVRVGNVGWVSGGALLTVPNVYGPGYPPPLYWKASAIDGIATMLWLCGENPSGASTWYPTFFRSDEATTIQHADDLTIGIFLENPDTARRFPLLVMVPTFRETPPSVGIPLPARDSDKLMTGDLAQQSWAHTESRILILANKPIHLWTPADVQFTTLYASYVGWSLTGHSAALENDEGYFEVRSGTKALGIHRPWHGLFGIVGDADVAAASSLDVVSHPNGLTWWAHREETDDGPVLKVAKALGSLNAGFLAVSTAVEGDVSHPALASHPNGRLTLGYTDGSAFKAVHSDDDGATWGAAETLMTGEFGRIFANDAGDMMRAAVRADGSDFRIYVQFRGSGATAWSSEVALAEASTPVEVEEDVFGLAYDYGTGGWLIYARRAGETDRTVFLCTDPDAGITWKEV